MNALTRALLLGSATGLRTFMGAAWWSGDRGSVHSVTHRAPVDRLLENDGVAAGARLAAAAELVSDKLPFIGDRISPGPLIARAVMGGLLGWAAAGESRREHRAIACLGGLSAAILSAHGGYHARRLITRSGAPDLPIAAAEDAIAVALAAAGSRLS